ncbi:MAG TPA: hypothetical protein VGA22_09410 [Gemmatimonadales bacterium]|jgi:TRAP-type uncharacterized transport system fused permease subunit
MGIVAKVAAAVIFFVAYYWLIDRHLARSREGTSRFDRLLSLPPVFLIISVLVPIVVLIVILGAPAWRLLLAGWVWALGGGILGLSGALAVQLVEKRLPAHLRDPIERAVFWIFFVIGGLGLVGLLIRVTTR